MSEPTETSLLEEALTAERRGRFDEARATLRRATESGQASLDVQLRLAKLLVQGGPRHHGEAEARLNAARTVAEQSGALRQAATAIHLLALLHRHRDDLDHAKTLLDSSPAAQSVAAPSPTRAQWLHYHGLIESDRGNLNNAERYYFRAHQVYLESRDDLGLAEVCDSVANLLLRRGKARVAEKFAMISLETKRALGDQYGEAISLGTIGRCRLLQARFDEAAEAFRADLKIARELGDTRGVGIMLNSLGEVAMLRKDFETASTYFREALGIDAGPIHIGHARHGFAWAELSAGRIESAANALVALEGLIEPQGTSHRFYPFLIGLRGAIAGRSGDHDGGERLLLEAIALVSGEGAAIDVIPWLYELRDIYQARDERARAVGVMTQAIDILSECGSERGVDDVEQWIRTVDTPKLTRLALERHFPSHLVGEILDGRIRGAHSAKQQVTVLFCDIRDYTTLSEGLDASQIVEILNEWFTEATRAIQKHKGMVDKFIGDAVMALFGVPDPGDDAAANAVRAALEMRDVLAAMNMRNQALGGKTIRIGIGIDSGEAVVGFVGSHLRQSYTAIGDTVNTASRLESATKDYRCDILISGAIEEQLRHRPVAETRYVGRLKLKGRAEQEPAYEVLGPLVPPAHVN